MALFNLNATAHPATITHDYAKVSKERMIARVGSIKASLALDARKGGQMSAEKKSNLKEEVKGILRELGAREEALDKIVESLT